MTASPPEGTVYNSLTDATEIAQEVYIGGVSDHLRSSETFPWGSGGQAQWKLRERAGLAPRTAQTSEQWLTIGTCTEDARR